MRGSISLRLTSIGGGLPFLIWYYYDEADPGAPLWLVMLRHEGQDREALDPSTFDS